MNLGRMIRESESEEALRRSIVAELAPMIESVVKDFFMPAATEQLRDRVFEQVTRDMDGFIRERVNEIARDKLAALVGAKVEAQVRLVVDEA